MEVVAPICEGCGLELAPRLLACPSCRKLVHGAELKQLAAEAEAAERAGQISEALGKWRDALELLPAGSKQHAVISATLQRLSEEADRVGAKPPPPPKGMGAKGTAGAGAIALVAWKLKYVLFSFLAKAKLLASGLTSIPTLLSMLTYVALDPRRSLPIGAGVVACIYIHEMGHVAALRTYGIKATAPMFVPGLGALVRLKQYPASAREDARVGLAGPLWGCAASILALAPGLLLRNETLLAIASFSASINAFNLIPFWQLDGARGFRALDTKQRGIVATVAVLVALLLDQPMGWVIAAVGGLKIKSDLPPKSDRRAFFTFAGLLVVLSLVSWAGTAAQPARAAKQVTETVAE